MNDEESLEERGAEVGISAFTSCLCSTIAVHTISQSREDPGKVVSFIDPKDRIKILT